MANLSEVIARLQQLQSEHGNIEVRIVNYHSDYRDSPIEEIKNAIVVRADYVLIGGEDY